MILIGLIDTQQGARLGLLELAAPLRSVPGPDASRIVLTTDRWLTAHVRIDLPHNGCQSVCVKIAVSELSHMLWGWRHVCGMRYICVVVVSHFCLYTTAHVRTFALCRRFAIVALTWLIEDVIGVHCKTRSKERRGVLVWYVWPVEYLQRKGNWLLCLRSLFKIYILKAVK